MDISPRVGVGMLALLFLALLCGYGGGNIEWFLKQIFGIVVIIFGAGAIAWAVVHVIKSRLPSNK